MVKDGTLKSMISDGTGRFGGHVVVRIGASSRAGRIHFDVFVRTDQIGGDRTISGSFLVFQRPLLLRAINLAKVVYAGIFLSRRAGFHEVRNGDRGQQTDDGHHDHDFHQGETRLTGGLNFHTLVI